MTTHAIQKFFKQFGLSISPDEAADFLQRTERNTEKLLDARPDINKEHYYKAANSLMFSPTAMFGVLKEFAQDSSQDPFRKKKFSEEIFPVMEFLFALKMLGLGEYYLLPQDAPDILLVTLTDDKRIRTLGTTIPVEVLRLSHRALKNSEDLSEIAQFIIDKKFSKRYEKGTVLLVVIDAMINMNIYGLHFALKDKASPFSQVWLHGQHSEDVAIVMSLLPYPVMVPISALALPEEILY